MNNVIDMKAWKHRKEIKSLSVVNTKDENSLSARLERIKASTERIQLIMKELKGEAK
jgi:hypothetical protein